MSTTRLIIALLAPLLAGCAVGPDFERPAAPAAQNFGPTAPTTPTATAEQVAQSFDPHAELSDQWWRAYNSPALDALVTQALADNPGLDAAQAALRQASALTAAQRGYYLPTLSAGLGASSNLTAVGALAPAAASGNPYYTLVTGQLGISYVVDVFGANRRAVESLAAQEEVARFQAEATRITLANNVVTTAIAAAALRDQIDATEKTIAVESDLLAILERQRRLGAVSMADVAAQQTALAQARQALPPLQRGLAQQNDLLATLLGKTPADLQPSSLRLDDLQLPQSLPISLPAALVDQRPDLRAAEAELHAASANVGIAVAARLPQILLVGQLGNSPNQLQNMFMPGTNFWTLAGGLTGPIFDAGTLMFRQRAAQAAFEQAGAQYRAVALAAMQNVADCLAALDTDANALAAAAAAEQAAARSLDIARRQLALGQIAYAQVLAAEQAYQTAMLSLIQARAARLADTAALFQALGGGWWNRPANGLDSQGATL